VTREELIADLLSRLSRITSSEDAPAAVTDPVVADALAELGQATTSDDGEAAYVLAAVHSARYVFGPHEDGELDWVEALRWCGHVLPVAPQQALDLLGPLLVHAGPTDHETPEPSRSRERRRAAIELLVQAAADIPTDNPSRGGAVASSEFRSC
jgi:hypothetical protein